MQVTARLHGVLAAHADGRRSVPVDLAEEAAVSDLLDALAVAHPGVERRIRDETGCVRRHINLFLDGEHLRGDVTEATLHDGAEVLVLPAVSGG